MSRKTKSKLITSLLEILLFVCISFIIIVPLLIMILGSFKDATEVTAFNLELPKQWLFENYVTVFVKRWHMIDDFANPEFFPGKLKMMEKKRPQNFLLTGMSDLSGWKPEWRDEVFAKIRENPQHQFLFLTKRPDLLDFDTELENAWFGVTVTRKAELWRIDALRKNVKAKHYHVTFEPLFDDPGAVDLSRINWIVVGTMTGVQSRKVHTEPEWAWSLTDQADKLGIPVFMKEDLVPIIGDENMIQMVLFDCLFCLR